MKKFTLFLGILALLNFANADTFAQSADDGNSADLPKTSLRATHFTQNDANSADLPNFSLPTNAQNDANLTENSATKNLSSHDSTTKGYTLEASVITATTDETKKYSSGSVISKDLLDSTPSGNGDLTSALKILPNVQFDNAQLSSNTPGEIDPANISISGGLFYQNNFQLDGFNINNDLDPIGLNGLGWGGSATGGASQNLRAGRSQGFNVDTSLLDSIVVLDSNIGAAYGGFTGGVVEANVRAPRRDRWHFDVSYQHTSDRLTKYHIHEDTRENFEYSSDENFQPNFSKHIVKANVEGWITEKFGIVGAFSTTRSKIPLKAYSEANRRGGTDIYYNRTQTRQSDNYYLKTFWHITDDFTLEANLGYMPQFNEYFINTSKDSYYTMRSGGYQAGLKGIWDAKFGLWTNQLGYSFMENSRRSDKNYRLNWRYSAADKNWARSGTTNASAYAYEGGLSDVDQIQQSLDYKSDLLFEPVEFMKIRVGAEFSYQYVNREVLKDYYYNTTPTNLNGGSCSYDAIFGVPLCSSATTANNWNGQYIKTLNIIRANKVDLDVFNYAFYAEDDIKVFDYKDYGEFSVRFGLRFDGDSYMDKDTVAPRFSTSYVLPWRGEGFDTRLNFGANRYYGRNLFSYRLYDSILAYTQTLTRANANSAWTISNANENNKQFKFNELEVPYSDEVMIGVSQDLGVLNLSAKYIKRQGRDEIMRRQATQQAAANGYARTYSYYTNEGKSNSDIISVSLENTTPLQTLNISHHYLLAFDWTDVERSYNLLNYDETYIDNPDILYDGQVVKYHDRPVENFTRPYTIRLNTTHSVKFSAVKFLWNNFFRYRSAYDRMLSKCTQSALNNTNNACSAYLAAYPTIEAVYEKRRLKGAFNWDMRVGLEFALGAPFDKDVGNFYVNVDIINVLNLKNETTLQSTSGVLGNTILGTNAIALYDVGRQFWLQFGYKW